MSKYEQDILSTVNLHGRISVMELARILKVSDQTVRRIVKPMVAKGSLSKVHGALVSTQNVLDPPFLARMAQNPPIPMVTIVASVPPANITWASPILIVRQASPIACVAVAQAEQVATFGPFEL